MAESKIVTEAIERAKREGRALPGNLAEQLTAARILFQLCLDDAGDAVGVDRLGGAINNALSRIAVAAGEHGVADDSVHWMDFAAAITQAAAQFTASNAALAPQPLRAALAAAAAEEILKVSGAQAVNVTVESADQPLPTAH